MAYYSAQSSKLTSRHDRHHKSKAQKHYFKHNSHSQIPDAPGRVDFLFVATELVTLEHWFTADRWGNPVPPADPENFLEMIVGSVFRYRDGNVFRAPDYIWERNLDSDQPDGVIYREWTNPSTGEYHRQPCIEYSHGTTVFNCGPFLPALIAPTDVMAVELMDEGDHVNSWRALRLSLHGEVFRVSTNHQDLKHIAPPGASWLGSIIPKAYSDPNPENRFQNARLGGDFGTIIGLMALGQAPSQESGNIEEAFDAQKWRNYCWSARRHSLSFTSDPRGVFVHMFVDPYFHNVEETIAAIRHAEMHERIIEDNNSH